MSYEQILDMVKQSEDLINGSIISNDLNSILIGFCDLINHQNDEIDKLKQILNKKEGKEDEIELLKKEFLVKDEQIAQLTNQLAILASNTQNELVRSRQETEIFKTQFNDQHNASLRKISELEKLFEGQIQTLSIQNTHSEEKLKKYVEEIAKQSDKLDFDFNEMKIQLNTFIHEQNQSKIELPAAVVEKPPPTEEKNISFDSTIIKNFQSQISNIEEKVEHNQKVISEVHLNSQHFYDHIKNSEKKIEKLIDDETSSISNRISSLEKQFESVPEIHDLILSGKEIGLKPILQAVMRDSRRLDSFDQQVSSVRNECENVASGMIALTETVKQFNHQIFDFGIEVKNNSNKIINEVDSVKNFCKFLGKIVNSLISDLTRITDGHHHLTSTIILSADEISHLMSLVAGRRLKTINLFDDINLEASDLCADLSQKKINVNMEKQIQSLDGLDIETINEKKLKNISVPDYQKVVQTYKASKVLGREDDLMYGNDNNHLIISSLEELRIRVNDIAKVISESNDSVNLRFNDVHNEIKKKMDSNNVDRIILKIQNLLKKVQNEVDDLKSKKHSFSFTSEKQNSNKNDNLNINLNKTKNNKIYDDNNLLVNSISESRLVSSSISLPLRSTQSSALNRPRTAVPASIMSKKMNKKFNETQRKSRNKDINNSIPIIQKVSSSKLASSVVSNPKDFT